MLVATMTLEEIKHNIDKEMPSVMNKVRGYSKTYLKHVSKYKVKTFERFHEYQSLTKNRWLMFFRKKEGDELQFMICVYFQMETGYGALIYNKNWFYYLTPHFIKRYNERLDLNLIQPMEKLKHYMWNTEQFSQVPLEEVKPGIMKYFATTTQGVVVGTYHQRLNIFKLNTFLNHKMLSGRQTNLANHCAERLDKYLPYAEMGD